eukprot:5312674-Prorocentrum_lima.AAC.1
MTSSLVGSEMCIRDRVRPGPGPGQLSRLRREGGRAAHTPHALADADAAVSYTHLTLPTICSV